MYFYHIHLLPRSSFFISIQLCILQKTKPQASKQTWKPTNYQIQSVLPLHLRMCGLPLQCSLVTRGNTLSDNPFPVPQQLAISNSILADGGSFCIPFPLCRDLVWLEFIQVLSILWTLLLVHMCTNSAMSRKHCFPCSHLLPLALRLFLPSLPFWVPSLGKTQYG